MTKMSPETINVLKMWTGKTPPMNIIYNTPNTPNNTPDNTPNINKIIISPVTNLYLKTFLSKTPPTSIFEVKRKTSLETFKL